MKNRRKIMKFMSAKGKDYQFSISDIVRGTNLKKSQIDYELKLMSEGEIVEKYVNMQDLRGVFYARGKNFDEEYNKS